MPRAAPLPPDERRAALLAATAPLVERHGRDVSTRQIAEAAGVAEGTIFRVFASKDSLIDACLANSLDVGQTCEALAAIDPELDLEPAVTAAVAVLAERVGRVVAMIHAARLPPPSPAQVSEFRDRHAAQDEQLAAALATLLERYASRLRHPPAEAAAALRTLSFSLSHPMLGEGRARTPEQIADLVLHGLAGAPGPGDRPC